MPRPPKTFASFIGQARVVNTLRLLADGARAANRTVPHLLLVARAGLGKTSLAKALSRHAGSFADNEEPTNFHLIQAGRGSLMQIHRVLLDAKIGDFIFVDEAHALGEQDGELLYLAMDADRTAVLNEDGRLDRSRLQPIAATTVVLATNQPGRLPKALYSRTLTLELDAYTDRELCAVAKRVAAHHGVDLTPQAARVVAERAGGSPRRVEQMLLLVDSIAPRGTRLTQSQIEEILAKTLGHDEHGLSPLQRRLLALLDRSGSMRAEQIVNILGVDHLYVRREIEGPLEMRGLMTVTTNHVRQITLPGRAVLALAVGEGDGDTGDDSDSDDGGTP